MGNVEPLSVNYVLDFSTSRGLTYYTGLIFDISLNHLDHTVVGGGGRYDGLVKMLGGSEDVPAVGFAITLILFYPQLIHRTRQHKNYVFYWIL